MGAELICYIALGPTRIDLDESKMTTVATQVRHYMDACIRAAERIIMGEKDVPDPRPEPVEADGSVSLCLEPLEVEPGRFRCLEDLRADPEYQDRIRDVLRGCDRNTEAKYAFAGTPDALAKKVQVFVDGWNRGAFPDLVTREDPRDPTWKIVVAGEMLCGDEPDGLGYQMLKEAFSLTIAQMLDVK